MGEFDENPNDNVNYKDYLGDNPSEDLNTQIKEELESMDVIEEDSDSSLNNMGNDELLEQQGYDESYDEDIEGTGNLTDTNEEFQPYPEMSTEMGDTYREWGQQVWNDASDKEKRVIDWYTSPNGYVYMNEVERGIDNPNLSEEQKDMCRDACETLAGVIDRNECPQDAKVYRCIGGSETQEIIDAFNNSKDKIIEHKGFMSGSVTENGARGFSKSIMYEDKEFTPVMRINTPKGTPSISIAGSKNFGGSEGEVLFQRNTMYEINNITKVEDPVRKNYLYIDCSIKK